ncbi:MAG: PfkB family carbohydrate kinase, partial [Planctomycetota bacterium]
ITDNVELNVLAEAPPSVPDHYRDSKYVFLANTAPALQSQLLAQMADGVFAAADSMNCWIHNNRDDLKTLLKKISCLIVNEDEARMLAGKSNLIMAAAKILGMGPAIVIIKKGESGSLMVNSDGERFILPAFPADTVKDPTGAGDSFAGGLMGFLAKENKTDFATLKKAVAYGTVVASFTIQEFSVKGLAAISKEDIDQRLEILRQVTGF